MSDKQWELFFSLLERIVDMENGMSWEEKADLCREKATDNGAESHLEEFVTWF